MDTAGGQSGHCRVQVIGVPARGEVTGTIRVAAFRSAAFHLLPGVLVRFGQRYPKMTVTVRIVPDLGRGSRGRRRTGAPGW
ncbi:LysR substrate-binding domain-containing protein [Nonomuraea thailandensis]|uniref:LysR substrate-binding domain-containing protein n=1 Tax=Nonomuraea thailandensis TaxID=1188745 RepID=UPI00360CD21F